MASSSSSAPAADQVMAEKTNNQTGPNHHQPLQCPRCNSSNTKFCYYNNYSLSQPRHFCKACKRYWTRGGTLRNVPVGGGCRKNKRLKRPPLPPASDGDGTSSAATAATSNTNSKIDLSPSSNHLHNNPSFYSFPTNNNLLELNYFPFSSLSSTRVCDNNTTGYDFQPQINGVGLGFSSGLMANEVPKQISSTPGNNSIFLGSSDFSSSSTMASLLASSFQQQKVETNGSFRDMINAAANGLMPYEETRRVKSENGSVVMGEDGKFFGWNQNPNPNPFEQLNSSDPSSMIWNTNNLGAWFGPSNSNMDSSVPSL